MQVLISVFQCVVYCIAVIFVAARVVFYYLLKENFDFLFNSKCKYDNFLRIAYRQHKNIKIINICVPISTLGFTQTPNCCYNGKLRRMLMYQFVFSRVIRKRKSNFEIQIVHEFAVSSQQLRVPICHKFILLQ